MKTGLREQIKNAPDVETIARLMRGMLASGYKAPYVARCLRAVDKRLSQLARKGDGK